MEITAISWIFQIKVENCTAALSQQSVCRKPNMLCGGLLIAAFYSVPNYCQPYICDPAKSLPSSKSEHIEALPKPKFLCTSAHTV